ncbi:MAG: hypothetical protein KIS96_11350 [Bauldia sp.]|nr:hypothetical protein [Bauldia sp.]
MLLGYTDEEITQGGIEWDHWPALGLRLVDPATGELIPHPNDPHAIRPMRKAAHAAKTSGTKATSAGSDIHAIAKVRRLTKAQEESRRRMLARDQGEALPKSKWPKRSLRGGNSFARGKR